MLIKTQRIYVATGTEEPNITCFVLGDLSCSRCVTSLTDYVSAWDSYEDHKALMDHKDYPEVGEKLKPLLGGEPKMVHIAFGDDTRPALTYPLTQVTTLELKDKQDPEKKEAFKTAMVEMIDDCHRLPNAKQRASFCFGETREHPGTFYLLGGWNSVEVRIFPFFRVVNDVDP